MAGQICPECGTESRPGTVPGCACASRAAYGATGAPGHATDPARAAEQQRIADEHHAGRSAEMAAAEDFDPLRIRPYVTLGGDAATAAPTTPPPGAPQVYGPEGDAATTMPLFLDPAGPPPADAGAPADTALLLGGPDPVAPRRRKPFAAVIAGAAVVTVVGTAAFIGGLFNGDGNGEADLDHALPSTVASLPDESEPSPSTTPTASAPPPRSPSPSSSASASASPSTSASPSASASRSAPASSSASPSGASSSPSASAETSGPVEGLAPPVATPDEAGTLRLGDHGPEVAELQRRLKDWRVGLFYGPIDSDYTDRVEHAVLVFQSGWGVTGDPDGVYGPNTRRLLEKATSEYDWH
ncbi:MULTISPECIES: peptidoglycan-binding domain-containing protein [unclassified Streptomyces]|uniref:peptidoglycan-binding domain-containing protein n=1 Tax=unclassified Streptomyces TaxID=2593676 RepID=UPI002ED1BD9B|nr:peptidoglycan-binding protein [Streptomyces sp. NBC_00891]WSY05250.1 peptidoglycan-binding protein [Streptomyces sp. NBC_00890]WSZ06874.1 peptidoglycan-binding protein [Streptomyces sp. NBC_00869]WSZ25628.1 peptidoglycan-binding protein [Streptomyces sp. NBC_00870]